MRLSNMGGGGGLIHIYFSIQGNGLMHIMDTSHCLYYGTIILPRFCKISNCLLTLSWIIKVYLDVMIHIKCV